LAAAIKAGIISGRGRDMIAPSDNATRAEVATMLYRLLKTAGRIK
jgi:hypothetical protein